MEELIRHKVNKFRHWKPTSLGRRHREGGGFQFTVMTYNILSQTAVDGHLYLYRRCDPRHLAEDYRISRILPEILRSRSDVVCLQEVEQAVYDARIRGALHQGGFGSLFKRRTGGKSDGCAILWRKDKFSLVTHREVEFKRVRGGSDGPPLDRDNVGLIAVLRPRHPGAVGEARLHVATTHLLYNPRRGDVKLCQLRLLLAELEKCALKRAEGSGERRYHPTLLCGDFNFEPHSPLYRFVETGRLDVAGMKSGDLSGQREGRGKGGAVDGVRLSLDRIGIDASGRFASSGVVGRRTVVNDDSSSSDSSSSGSSSSSCSDGASDLFFHDFHLVPTYKYHGDMQRRPATSMTGDECNAVDHIFYGVRYKSAPTHYEEGEMRLLSVYSLPRADDLRDIGGLPNAHLGSDHVCLQSRFLLRGK